MPSRYPSPDRPDRDAQVPTSSPRLFPEEGAPVAAATEELAPPPAAPAPLEELAPPPPLPDS